jgi:hypothetical protein
MKASDLKLGDRIRITRVPGEGVPGYFIHRDTVYVYKKLIVRGRSVRIRRIDEYGSPWYICRFKTRRGAWETHYLAVYDSDNNWVPVRSRVVGASSNG